MHSPRFALAGVLLLTAASGCYFYSDDDDCQYGGWYYNPPGAPESIELCSNTCDVVSQQTGAGFQVLFGCATVVVVK